jgi:hypothetical protein
MMPGPDDFRTVAALLTAIGASLFWVAAIMETLMGSQSQAPLARAASAATALAASAMLAQIAYAFSCTTCAQ